MSLLSSWGWLFVPIGLFGSILFCLIFGVLAPFEDEQSRQDWLWSGLMVGILMAIMWVLVD